MILIDKLPFEIEAYKTKRIRLYVIGFFLFGFMFSQCRSINIATQCPPRQAFHIKSKVNRSGLHSLRIVNLKKQRPLVQSGYRPYKKRKLKFFHDGY